MTTIFADARIDRTPDEVWAVVGDIGGLSRWMPGIDAISLEGDSRVCEVGGGEVRLVEKVLSRDDTVRRYEYTITEGPVDFSHHRAAMSVVPEGTGSRFTWEITIEPDEAAEPMRATATAGAEALKSYLEGG